MRTSTVPSVVVFVLAGALLGPAACSKNTKSDAKPTAEGASAKADQSEDEGKAVVLYQYRFNPNTLTVSKGTKVTFKNKDAEAHRVRIAALDVDEELEPNEDWSYTFEQSGEYAVSNPGVDRQMKMTIVVEK